MKVSGVVRHVDKLGRFCIPAEMRRVMGIEVDDPVETYMSGDTVVMRKYQPGCVFCGGVEHLYILQDKYYCADCAALIAKSL